MSDFVIGYIGATVIFIWFGGWRGAGIVLLYTTCMLMYAYSKNMPKVTPVLTIFKTA